VNQILPGQRTRELEPRTRELDWMKARARDRRSWPSPAAWAQALLQLAGTAIIRAQAQARIFGGGAHREFFAVMASVERIAEDRFFVVRDGEAVYVTGPRRRGDPRLVVISKAVALARALLDLDDAGLDAEGRAVMGPNVLLAAADQQEKMIRRRRRSHRRGLQLAESYIARLPKAVASATMRTTAQPSRRPVRLFESCGDGWFIFNGEHGTPLEIDNEEDSSADWSGRGEVEVEL
jgi:hypothetical protein